MFTSLIIRRPYISSTDLFNDSISHDTNIARGTISRSTCTLSIECNDFVQSLDYYGIRYPKVQFPMDWVGIIALILINTQKY
jgi:hypothetical protein